MDAPEKRKPGRKAAGEQSKLEQFSVRLPPKLKFGLELLARAQHRSLSQAVEWAVQVGLNNYEIGDESVGSILDKAWAIQQEGSRTLQIYYLAPGLLTFEESRACELIDKSVERGFVLFHVENAMKGGADLQTATMQQEERRERFYRFVNVMWSRIKVIATELANSGRSTSNVSILSALGVKFYDENDAFALLDAIAEMVFVDDVFSPILEHLNKIPKGRTKN